MKILHYNGLDIKKIPNYKKVSQAIMEGNFARAQVKKNRRQLISCAPK